MESRFKNIDDAKRDKIINAALAEFAANGYEKASTNGIVKNAGISRGLLYHYFKDKKELYEVLKKYAVQTLADRLIAEIDWKQSDIFERLRQIAFVKIALSERYPGLFDFVTCVFTRDSRIGNLREAYALYEEMGIDIERLFARVYSENIDFSKFREPDKIAAGINIIRWTIEKWSEEFLARSEGFSAGDLRLITAELDGYIGILKQALYKPDGPEQYKEESI